MFELTSTLHKYKFKFMVQRPFNCAQNDQILKSKLYYMLAEKLCVSETT